jgi:tetratricopeptide (TPR) repeat protein
MVFKRILLFILLFSHCLFATTLEVEQLEKKYLTEFLKTSPSNDRKALVYLIVAQEFLNIGHEKKAREYYEKVIQLETKEDKSAAYIQFIMLSYTSESLDRVRGHIHNLYKYWDEYPQFNSQELRVIFDELQSLSDGSFNVDRVHETYFGHLRQRNHLQNLIANKEYEKAFLMFQREKVMMASIVEQTLYDLLHVLIKKRHVDELICSVRMNKYPNALSYNILICRKLNQYIQGQGFSEEGLKRLENLIKEDYPDQLYLVDMVRSLKP